ncbi:MAG: hypothetical protein IE931_15320, partial [Sphingobacteriales bacterium]|nr:hypothetical protein [Sphingobacteriales bacterium]
MAKGLFDSSKIVYLSLKQASNLHPIWQDKNLDIPLDAISPQDLVSLLGVDADDDWIEWLMISHPIILVEKQQKNREGDRESEVQYYRIMGHATYYYLASYLGAKYGSEALSNKRFPMTVIPQKKLALLQTQIFNSELVFSFLLQKSKKHIELMREHVFSSPAPIPQISTYRQLSK